MKRITIKCSVGTRFFGSETSAEFNFVVDDSATDEDIETQADNALDAFILNVINCGYEIIKTEKI